MSKIDIKFSSVKQPIDYDSLSLPVFVINESFKDKLFMLVKADGREGIAVIRFSDGGLELGGWESLSEYFTHPNNRNDEIVDVEINVKY